MTTEALPRTAALAALLGCAVGWAAAPPAAIAVGPNPAPPALVHALRRQIMGYAELRGLHFSAVTKGTLEVLGHRAQPYVVRYEFWSEGRKYRIDDASISRLLPADQIITDDGRRYEALNRTSHTMSVGPRNPRQERRLPATGNPALEPMEFLAPLRKAGTFWGGFRRFNRKNAVVLRQLRRLRRCARPAGGGRWHCAWLRGRSGDPVGSYHIFVSARQPRLVQKVTFTAPHHIYEIWHFNAYHRIMIPGGRSVWLPSRYTERWRFRQYMASTRTTISGYTLDSKPPPGIFHINYRRASVIRNAVTGHTIVVNRKGRNAPTHNGGH